MIQFLTKYTYTYLDQKITWSMKLKTQYPSYMFKHKILFIALVLRINLTN